MDAAHFPVILTYHSISQGDSPLKTAPSLFAEQMEWLRTHVRVAPLVDVVAALVGCTALPERTVVLTFDDGFSDFYSAAAPVLRRLGLPATIFLATGYCGKTNHWPGQPAWVGEQPLLDWPQVTELAQQGFDFGAHSVHHPVLTDLAVQQAEHDIADCKAELEHRAGRQVEFFAYPYGIWNFTVRALVQRHYRGACSTGAGAVEPNADPFALPRVDASYLRRPILFRTLFTAPCLAYLATRRFIRKVRRQPEGFYARV